MAEKDRNINAFDSSPKGTKVEEVSFATHEAKLDYISDTIKKLIRVQEFSAEQILILIPGRKADSCLALVDRIGGYELTALGRQGSFRSGVIHYTNISVFKGLEADAVVLCTDGRDDDAAARRGLYTSASRARHVLCVVN